MFGGGLCGGFWCGVLCFLATLAEADGALVFLFLQLCEFTVAGGAEGGGFLCGGCGCLVPSAGWRQGRVPGLRQICSGSALAVPAGL